MTARKGNHVAGPLSGLSVIEMAGIGPTPLAGQLLADLGADVIIIDRADGPVDKTDVNRRGKRSVALNLKETDGRDAARALINRAGIVIEGFRPGVMERLGLGPKDLDDHVVFGRITGWGQTGPLAQTAGHDINYLGLTGALAAMGTPGSPPAPPLNLIADYGGGTMFLLLGILAAVFERQSSGKGQVVDAAMVDGVCSMMGLIHGLSGRGQWSEDRAANWLDGGAPFYRCYETKDGRYVSVGPLEPQFFAELLRLADLPAEHSADQNDPAHWEDRAELYARVFKTKTQAEWTEIFDGTDACVSPVLTVSEAAEHPHMSERGTLVNVNGVLQAAPAPRFSRSQPTAIPDPVAPGHDTQDILSDLNQKP